ncbi:hypothetical protein ACTMTI_24130 [Nonomuraea sp. H19]
MFSYFISGYRPEWLVGRADIQAVHGERLAALALEEKMLGDIGDG